MSKYKIADIAIVVTCIIVLAICMVRGCRQQTEEKVVVDTLRYDMPIARDSVVVRYETAKLRRVVNDTVYDTVYVEIPITQKVYGDSGSYRAWVSGYNPHLDSIEVYQKTVVRTKYKRFGVGVSAGIGYSGKIAPYVGIGVQYNLFGF